MPTKKSTPPPSDSSLNPDEILIAEFEYAAASAFQANEDRSKAASFFLVSVGSLVAAIFGALQKEMTSGVYLVLAGLFCVLTILGWLTVKQLARLREAWRESARTMNKIKDYYMGQFEEIHLKDAFRWRSDTLPNKYKTESVSHYTAIEVSLLSALTFSAGAFFFQLGLGSEILPWAFAIAAGTVMFFAELAYYKRLLTK
jgi:hypothetical protein